jgi:hypothetical protein
LIGKVPVLILVVEEVEEQVEEEEVEVEVVVVVVQYFVMNDLYFYCFHWNDLIIEFHQMVEVVEKNYFEMMNDYYKMIVHNVMALNHNGEEHEKNY